MSTPDLEKLAREMRAELRVCRTPQEQEGIILAALQRAVAENRAGWDECVQLLNEEHGIVAKLTAQLAAAKEVLRYYAQDSGQGSIHEKARAFLAAAKRTRQIEQGK